MTVHTSDTGSATEFVCPRCATPVTPQSEHSGLCQQAHVVDLAQAHEVAQRAAEVDQARRSLKEYEELTRQAQAYLRDREQALWSARQGESPVVRPTKRVHRRRSIPAAVLLQATGALIILAATVLAFAIAWTVLPAAGQSALMIALVVALGAITIALRRRVPTTSAVLAALTAAVATVVAVAWPSVAGFESDLYPPVAATVCSAALGIAGWLGRVTTWRHLAWVGSGVSVLLWTGSAANNTSVGQPLALATWLFAAGATGMLVAADQLRKADEETARTAWWVGTAVAVASLLTAVGTIMTAGLAEPDAPRLLTALAALATCPVLALLFRRFRWAGLLPLTVAVDVAVAPMVTTTVPAAVILPMLLAAQTGAGLLWSGWRHRQAVPWILAAIGSSWLVRLVLLTELEYDQLTMLWFNALLLALVTGASLVELGRSARLPLVAYLGATIAIFAWQSAYFENHLPDRIEYLSVPILVTLLYALHAVRGRSWPLPGVIAAAVLAVPSYVAALLHYWDLGEVDRPSLAWAVGILAFTLLLGWRHPPTRTVVAGLAGFGGASFLAVVMEAADWNLPEPYLLVFASAIAVTTFAACSEGMFTDWKSAPIAGGTFLLAGSYVTSLLIPVDDPGASLRRVLVGLILVALTVILRRGHRELAMLPGLAVLVLAGVAWAQWLVESPHASDLEAWTLAFAALATVAIWLTREPLGLPVWMLAGPAAIALGLSAAASLINPLGSSGYATVRSVLVLVALWSLTAVSWSRPKASAVIGAGAVALTWYQLVFMITEGSEYPVEVYTWSAAAAISVATIISVRIPHGHLSTMLTVAPAVSMALLPTALIAWSDGQTSWRVWFTLVVAGGSLLLGVRLGWAGLILPSIVAVGIVIVPVLTRLVQDLPAHVPLTLVGTALLVAGARLEWLRRQGRHLASWATGLH